MLKVLPSTESTQLIYDPSDPRLHFQRSRIDDSEFLILGYPDDEGIRVNGGRLGASEAPKEIRKQLFRMTPSLGQNPIAFHDLGDIEPNNDLSSLHGNLKVQLEAWHAMNKRLITLGGGHDFGYPDASAFLNAFKGKRPIVINFDAHLDVRPLNKGVSSGTPFFQLLSEHSNFDFLEVGVQGQCNSNQHLAWAIERGAKILTLDEIIESGESLKENLVKKFANLLLQDRPCFLSVDIDAFASSWAPGCSQSWPIGFSPSTFFPAFDMLLRRLDVRGLGIYEVSPPLDVAAITVKLAALLAHRFLYHRRSR